MDEFNRELDASIAEIMGGKWIRFYDADYSDPDSSDGRVHALIVLPKDLDFLCPPDYVKDTGECPRDRYGWIPEYSTDFAAAWEVHKFVHENWAFSQRSRYYDALTKVMHERLCAKVAWPALLGFLEPKDICLAAIMALEGD